MGSPQLEAVRGDQWSYNTELHLFRGKISPPWATQLDDWIPSLKMSTNLLNVQMFRSMQMSFPFNAHFSSQPGCPQRLVWCMQEDLDNSTTLPSQIRSNTSRSFAQQNETEGNWSNMGLTNFNHLMGCMFLKASNQFVPIKERVWLLCFNIFCKRKNMQCKPWFMFFQKKQRYLEDLLLKKTWGTKKLGWHCWFPFQFFLVQRSWSGGPGLKLKVSKNQLPHGQLLLLCAYDLKKNCLNLSGFAKATLPKYKKFKITPEKWPKPKRKGERFPTIVFSGGELLNFRKGFLLVWWDLMGSWLPWIERSILGFHHWKICPKKEGKFSIGWLKKLGAPLTKTTPDIPSHQKQLQVTLATCGKTPWFHRPLLLVIG